MGKAKIILQKRLRRWLDAAYARGSFDVSGSLCGVSAEAIADDIAAEWRNHTWFPGTGADAETLTPYVAAWLEKNR